MVAKLRIIFLGWLNSYIFFKEADLYIFSYLSYVRIKFWLKSVLFREKLVTNERRVSEI